MVDVEDQKAGAVLLPQPSEKLQRKQKIKTDTPRVMFSHHNLDVHFYVMKSVKCLWP